MGKSKYPQLKLKAIKLRKKGLSYREIGKELDVAKSTVRSWCINIPLSPGDRERLYTRQVLLLARGPNSQKERRIREIAKIISCAEKEIQTPLSIETYRLLGAALYWAEGSKTTGFKITNSDPDFILFMVKWLEKIFGVRAKNLKAWLNVYPQQNELDLKQFWSQLTGIPFENFGKSFIKPLSKNYKKNNLYYGTIRIGVSKGTDMRHRVYGWIKTVLKDVAPRVELTQKEWKSLKEVARPVNLPEDIKLPR